MKSVIICEGKTDLTLIQYFLEKVYNWEYMTENREKSYQEGYIHRMPVKDSKWLYNTNDNVLNILSSGGVSKIPKVLKSVLDVNCIGTIKPYENIVIISDRDEVGTENEFIKKLKDVFDTSVFYLNEDILHNKWNSLKYKNTFGEVYDLTILPLIIPFEETGAIETFLLNALSEASVSSDPEKIDKLVIAEANFFIDKLKIDCKGKYLKHRREITKAKFNTVFSVMTPDEAFEQRRSILRSVPWENYENVKNGFKQLFKLSENV